jgi:signal transduction histidine kinase/DNA-binding response OmpR family regulator/ligand-binding sensor domain-containing protein
LKIERYLLLILFVLITGFNTNNNPIFKNINSTDGLSQHDINCITQDNQGFLWFGTNDGLNKYDSYNFKVFRPSKGTSSGISGRIIQQVVSDPYGNLWIASLDGGLNHYNSKFETFSNFNDKLYQFGKYVNDVTISDDGILWVQFKQKTCYAVLKENIDEMEFHTLFSDDLIQPVEKIGNKIIARNGEVFLLSEKLLYKLKYDTKEDWLYNILFSRTRTENFISEVSTPNGSKWKLYRDKIIYKGHNQINITKNISNFSNYLGVSDPDGNLWCVINEKLAIISIVGAEILIKTIDFEKLKFVGLKNNSINCVFVDKTGNLWVGSNGGGIYKKTNSNFQFNHFNKKNTEGSLSGNKIRSLHEDQFGNLWIGTEGGGLNFLSKTTSDYNSFVSFTFSRNETGLTSNNIFSISENIIDSDYSILWFSTENGGLNKLYLNKNDKTKDFEFEKFNTPTNNGKNIKSLAIHSIYSEGKDKLWIGYYGLGLGLAQWSDPTSKPFFSFIKPNNQKVRFSGKIIRDIYRDNTGILWVATNNGLNKLQENRNDISKSYFKPFSLKSSDQISLGIDYSLQIFEASDNNLWIGTIGGGLIKLVRDENLEISDFKQYSSQNSLFPDDVINSVVEDQYGFLWVGTNSGIIRFDPQQETYETYSNVDLQNPEMSEISALKRQDGNLVFGGVNGINVFSPKINKLIDTPPNTVITDLSIMYEPVFPNSKINNKIILNQSVSHTDHISLNADVNNFSFSFSSLHYNDSKLNNYKYILEGFDENWIETNSDLRVANYTNIKPGDYIFKVYGSNNKGIWSEQPAKVSLTILPPWYLTLFAKIVYALLFLFLIYLLRKFTIIDTKSKRKLEYNRFEKEKEKEINRVKLEFFTNISHELRTPLTLILGPAEKLINKGDELHKKDRLKLYQTMRRNSDYLLKLIKQLLDYRKLDQGKIKLKCTHINLVTFLIKISDQFYVNAEQKGILLTQSISHKKLFVWIDSNIIEKILYNLISNAIKFTKTAGKITIGLKQLGSEDSKFRDGHVEISVTDNGKGIKSSELKNIFNRFYQSDNQNKENEGVGIGLSFSQNLAQLHGGKIEVVSECDKGSCFTLLLPLGNGHLFDDQMVENNEIYISNVTNEALPNLANEEQLVNFDETDKPSLLIIEDNKEIYNYLTSELRQYYRIVCCSDGDQGIIFAMKELPDIIISDIMMPGTDGIQVCKTLKNDIKTSHIPIILLSARANDESKVEGLESGADVYLTKPVSLEVLKTQITSLLNNREKIHDEFKNLNFEPSKIKISSVDELFVKNIIDIINDNIDNPNFTVQEFSNLSGMSRTSFFNKVKSITGFKPTEFLRNYRLKLASQFLLKGFSVKECIYKTGFNTPSYFTQSFKVLYKLTPTEYVKQNRDKL